MQVSLVGQAVKTLPSHGRISGSIPLRGTDLSRALGEVFSNLVRAMGMHLTRFSRVWCSIPVRTAQPGKSHLYGSFFIHFLSIYSK